MRQWYHDVQFELSIKIVAPDKCTIHFIGHPNIDRSVGTSSTLSGDMKNLKIRQSKLPSVTDKLTPISKYKFLSNADLPDLPIILVNLLASLPPSKSSGWTACTSAEIQPGI